MTFYQISDVIGNTTCKKDFQKIKNARQYYINFTDYLTTSYLNITNNKTYKTFISCAISLMAFLLDRLSAYSFNLYYVKGRDMILSDYLSRHRQKDLDPSQLILISFCCLKAFRSFIAYKIGEDIFKCKSIRRGSRRSTWGK